MAETQKNFLFIINDGPYGNERAYNALRHVTNLSKREGVKLRVFLIGDGVNCAIANQKTADGYYNVDKCWCHCCGGEKQLLEVLVPGRAGSRQK